MTVAPVKFAERVTDRECDDPELAPGYTAVRHRRRGAALEQAIHAAVLAELVDVGYVGLTIESVAARAHTGKASIYRRWPTKQHLVVESFCAKFGETFDLLDCELCDTLTTRDALLIIGQRMTQIVRDAGEAFRAASFEVSRDPELAAAMEEQVSCPKREFLLELLQRGVDRGEVRPGAARELYAEILPAMITSRLIVQNRPIADDYLVRVVDDVVMPLLQPV